jgi:hypothetical protein
MAIEQSDLDDLAVGQPRLAVLVDADNASPAVIEGLLAVVARFGVASVRRLYGDWTSQRHAGWKKVLLDHSLAPVQQFAYTTGKNATDSAMIIDAMDLMYTRRFGGFCLVSSDSDFTRLAQRLREEGLLVLGFGERKTPAPFVAACDKFIYTELLMAGRDAARSPDTADITAVTSSQEPADAAASKSPIPFELIERAIGESDDDDGWAHLGPVGSYLTKVRPDFDTRLYGFKKLSDLFRAHPARYELREVLLPGSGSRLIHVRLALPAPAHAPRAGKAAKAAKAAKAVKAAKATKSR